MEFWKNSFKHTATMLAMCLGLTACISETVPNRQLPGSVVAPGTTSGSGGGVGAGTTSGSSGGATAVAPKVEIRNLVEPKITTGDYPSYFTGTGLSGAGSYVRKLTLPKNYQGLLYLGGININSLQNRFVKVRFTFGVSREQVTVPATVARAPGITPNTEIDVLVMDLRNKPFDDQRLIYDLYDYRDYEPTDPLDPTTIADPVETNRDPHLYCRGLRLQDDPTFNGQGACDGKYANGTAYPEERCLYTYAKVVDRALTRVNGLTETTVFPTLPQLDLTVDKRGYYHQSTDTLMNRCLPDKQVGSPTYPVTWIANGVSNATSATGVEDLFFELFNQQKNLVLRDAGGTALFTQALKYHGPFKPINAANWEVTGEAVFSPYGLFESDSPLSALEMVMPGSSFATKMDSAALSISKQFPRFSYMDLPTNVKYLKTEQANLNTKDVATQASGGATELVDGCNLRVQSVNFQGEHIGSCNASGKIEILATNDDGVDIVMAETKEVILQLVRPTQISGQNQDYLYSNFKSCTNSNQCGSGECCYNQRCWSTDLVTQCVEQAPTVGNSPIGAACASDFECSSLCCNTSTGRCSVHDNRLDPPVLCNKPYGQFCIAKEWCQKSNVTNCYIVKTGTDPQGNITCAKRCYNSQEFGDCRAGVCQPPPPGLNPSFDPNAPNACDDAIDPPDL